MIWLNRWIIVLFVIGLAGCSGDSDPSTPEAETASAWSAFQQGDYTQAAEKADAALNLSATFVEAYVVGAWAYARLGEQNTALTYANQALQHQPSPPDQVDALAVRAFLSWTLDQIPNALDDAQHVLALDAGWRFSRGDPTVNASDIRLLVAQCFWVQAAWNLAQDQVEMVAESVDYPLILDANNPSTWVVNGVTYATYPEALLMIIEDLLYRLS